MGIRTEMQDVLLEAQADVEKFFIELTQELEEEDITAALYMMWQRLPMEMREQYRKENPDAYKLLIDMIGGRYG